MQKLTQNAKGDNSPQSLLTRGQQGTDRESEAFLNLLAEQERARANLVAGVRTVLLVLSARAMPFDMESLRQKILLSYPEAAVFFRTTNGRAAGVPSPNQVDLVIDFTGPGQRQGLLYGKKLRGMARVAVGRNAGFFRRRVYDKIFDEKSKQLPLDPFQRERLVQREVLALAGVSIAQMGDTPPDRGQSIALELPSMQKL